MNRNTFIMIIIVAIGLFGYGSFHLYNSAKDYAYQYASIDAQVREVSSPLIMKKLNHNIAAYKVVTDTMENTIPTAGTKFQVMQNIIKFTNDIMKGHEFDSISFTNNGNTYTISISNIKGFHKHSEIFNFIDSIENNKYVNAQVVNLSISFDRNKDGRVEGWQITTMTINVPSFVITDIN